MPVCEVQLLTICLAAVARECLYILPWKRGGMDNYCKIVHPRWRKLYFDCINWLEVHPDWLDPILEFIAVLPRLSPHFSLCLFVNYFLRSFSHPTTY